MAIQVLIVDDHGVVRRGLRMFLEDDPELAIVGEARDGAEAVAQAQALKPNVILMDLLMPVMDGIGETTVLTHVSSILAKLGVQSRTQAALYAAQIGLAKLEGVGTAAPGPAERCA